MMLRWAMLAAATWATLLVLGLGSGETQPSTMRVTVVAVVGLLAPLWWPGRGNGPWQTLVRVLGWSAAAAVLAAMLLVLIGGPGQSWALVAQNCLMLLAVLLITHATAAALEGLLRRGLSTDHGSARAAAGRTVALVLATVGALPLWLGPTAELLSQQHEGLLDAAVGLSPLTHLAVASGNDLLRNEWFYQHSNLATLPFQYPSASTPAAAYAGALALLALSAWLLRLRRQGSAADPQTPFQERPQ